MPVDHLYVVFGKMSFSSSAYFLFGFFFPPLRCVSSLSILDIADMWRSERPLFIIMLFSSSGSLKILNLFASAV